MKTIDLTTWERIQLALVVGSHVPGRGTTAAVRLGCKALDVLELTEDEQQMIGFVAFPDGRVQWPREQDREWPLEFEDTVWNFVEKRADAFTDWPVNRLTEALLDKILPSSDSKEEKEA